MKVISVGRCTGIVIRLSNWINSSFKTTKLPVDNCTVQKVVLGIRCSYQEAGTKLDVTDSIKQWVIHKQSVRRLLSITPSQE